LVSYASNDTPEFEPACWSVGVGSATERTLGRILDGGEESVGGEGTGEYDRANRNTAQTTPTSRPIFRHRD